MGVFARWVVGWGVCATARVRVGVCAFGVGALVGWWDSSVSPPRLSACLALTSWRGWLWRVRAGSARRAGRLVWAGHGCPAHTAWRCPRCVAWGREERRVVCSRGGEHTHAQREGRHRPGACWPGWWRGLGWCVRFGAYNPCPVDVGEIASRRVGRVGLGGGDLVRAP